MSPESLDPDLTALAGRLAALAPAAPAVSRDQILYRAGQAAAEKSLSKSRLASGVIAAICLGGGLWLGRWSAPDSRIVEHMVAVEPEQVTPKAPVKSEPAKQEGDPIQRSDAVAKATDSEASFPPEPLSSLSKSPLQKWRSLELPNPPAARYAGPEPRMPLEQLLGVPAESISPTDRRRWRSVLHSGDPS